MKFRAKEVFADYDENEVLIVAFSGLEIQNNEQVYFMIQYSNEYNQQDTNLGLNEYYIEKNSQLMGCYGGIKELRFFRNSIQIDLNSIGLEHLKETNIEIDFECDSSEFENLGIKLEQVFSAGELKKIV